uniref:Uncharacterized protein LOC102806362 n=1 Tax=Saccoglossus kowalevskii TaxID=10224 RepID=A0ABM0MBD0_SACKO|nr:PREDICTED: uncharacterized protein LOC102806362 [Saccoglossus kowalevskii]
MATSSARDIAIIEIPERRSSVQTTNTDNTEDGELYTSFSNLRKRRKSLAQASHAKNKNKQKTDTDTFDIDEFRDTANDDEETMTQFNTPAQIFQYIQKQKYVIRNMRDQPWRMKTKKKAVKSAHNCVRMFEGRLSKRQGYQEQGAKLFSSADPNDSPRKQLPDEDTDTAMDLETVWDLNGYLKYSMLFYGWYSHSPSNDNGYRLPLAYLLVGIATYAVSFLIILRRMAQNSKMNKISSPEEQFSFSWKLFTGWDYMIGNPETADNTVAANATGFRESLIELEEKEKQEKSTPLTIFLRVLANFLVLIILCGSGYVIYQVVLRSQEFEKVEDKSQLNWWQVNEVSIVVTGIGIICPNVFELIGAMESYHPRKALRWQLARIMVLYMGNLYTLIIALLGRVSMLTRNSKANYDETAAHREALSEALTGWLNATFAANETDLLGQRNDTIDNLQNNLTVIDEQLNTLGPDDCWETYVGQEFFKLVLFDGLALVLGILVGDYLRALLVRYLNGCCCCDLEKKFPEYPEFKIAENVLHLVYNQGMVWMGCFFAPCLPAFNVLKLIVTFYVRAWACIVCNVPHERVFRASGSHNFYLTLLLVMLFLCVLAFGYAIVDITPSYNCGPFSGYNSILDILGNSMEETFPPWLNAVIDYINTAGVVVPLILLLSMIIYYFWSVSGSYKEANNELRIQLLYERSENRKKLYEVTSSKNEEPKVVKDQPRPKHGVHVMPKVPTDHKLRIMNAAADKEKPVQQQNGGPKTLAMSAGVVESSDDVRYIPLPTGQQLMVVKHSGSPIHQQPTRINVAADEDIVVPQGMRARYFFKGQPVSKDVWMQLKARAMEIHGKKLAHISVIPGSPAGSSDNNMNNPNNKAVSHTLQDLIIEHNRLDVQSEDLRSGPSELQNATEHMPVENNIGRTINGQEHEVDIHNDVSESLVEQLDEETALEQKVIPTVIPAVENGKRDRIQQWIQDSNVRKIIPETTDSETDVETQTVKKSPAKRRKEPDGQESINDLHKHKVQPPTKSNASTSHCVAEVSDKVKDSSSSSKQVAAFSEIVSQREEASESSSLQLIMNQKGVSDSNQENIHRSQDVSPRQTVPLKNDLEKSNVHSNEKHLRRLSKRSTKGLTISDDVKPEDVSLTQTASLKNDLEMSDVHSNEKHLRRLSKHSTKGHTISDDNDLEMSDVHSNEKHLKRLSKHSTKGHTISDDVRPEDVSLRQTASLKNDLEMSDVHLNEKHLRRLSKRSAKGHTISDDVKPEDVSLRQTASLRNDLEMSDVHLNEKHLRRLSKRSTKGHTISDDVKPEDVRLTQTPSFKNDLELSDIHLNKKHLKRESKRSTKGHTLSVKPENTWQVNKVKRDSVRDDEDEDDNVQWTHMSKIDELGLLETHSMPSYYENPMYSADDEVTEPRASFSDNYISDEVRVGFAARDNLLSSIKSLRNRHEDSDSITSDHSTNAIRDTFNAAKDKQHSVSESFT